MQVAQQDAVPRDTPRLFEKLLRSGIGQVMNHLRSHHNVEAVLPEGQRCSRCGYVAARWIQTERWKTDVQISDLPLPTSSGRPAFESGSKRTVPRSKIKNRQRSAGRMAQHPRQQSLEGLGE